MYYVQNVQVKPEDSLYSYCDRLTKAANNLYNATLFRIRQVMTGVKKDPSELTENEKNVFEEIQSVDHFFCSFERTMQVFVFCCQPVA